MISTKTKIAVTSAIILWASAFVGIRAGLTSYSPEGLALLRFIVASLCMAIIYFRLPKRQAVNFRDLCGLFGLGFIGIGIYNIALNYGEMSVSSGMASFIVSQSPIISALAAIPFLGERLTFSRIVGFIISMCGVMLILIGEEGGFHWNINVLYVFVATISGSIFIVLQKPFLKRFSAIEATALVIWGGTLFLLFYTPKLLNDLPHASLSSTLTVIYLGIFPAAIGYVAWGYALSEMPASRTMSFLYFVPFVATLLGWLWLDEVPALISLGGGLLAIIGVWLVNHSYRLPKLPREAIENSI